MCRVCGGLRVPARRAPLPHSAPAQEPIFSSRVAAWGPRPWWRAPSVAPCPRFLLAAGQLSAPLRRRVRKATSRPAAIFWGCRSSRCAPLGGVVDAGKHLPLPPPVPRPRWGSGEAPGVSNRPEKTGLDKATAACYNGLARRRKPLRGWGYGSSPAFFDCHTALPHKAKQPPRQKP